MKHLIALALVLGLTACGGGGGGGSPNTPAPAVAKESTFPCVTLQSTPGKYRAALIDVPHDHNSVTALGINATGLQHVSKVIDRAKCVGFDTIVFQSFIPIDPATGALVYYDPSAPVWDRNRDLPPDYWKFVDYAKKQGLTVVLKMVPSNYKDDEPLRNIVPVAAVLDSLNSYYKMQAQQAEIYHVDAMHVGHFQTDMDGPAYATQWRAIIGNVRSVFSGKLIYASCDQCSNNVVWDLVDIISINFGPSSTPSCTALVTQIVPLYQQVVNSAKTLSQRYQKPIWLDEMDFETAGCNFPTNSTYTMVMSGQLSTASYTPNYSWQSNSIRAVFETVAGNLNTQVSGMTFGTYLPWIQADWIQNPTTDAGRLFNAFDKLGYSLYNNDQAQYTIEEYLGKPWGYRIYY